MKPTVSIPIFFADSTAFKIFLLSPLVDIAINTSSFVQSASIWRLKISSKPKSFPIEVIALVSVVKATDFIGFLFF